MVVSTLMSFEKVQLLNDFYTKQTHLDERNATLPNLALFNGTFEIDSIILNSNEVGSVLKSLASGKASGRDELNNRILKELSKELAQPLCNFFIFPMFLKIMDVSFYDYHMTALDAR